MSVFSAFEESRAIFLKLLRIFLLFFLLSFAVSSLFPEASQIAVNSYTVMLPSFNLISEYAPIIKYDAYKVFGFIVANNLIVIAVICFIGYFGLSFIHPAAFAMLSGALAGIYLNNNLTQFIYLLIYTSMEAFNYLMAATVSMKDAELRMSFTSFKGHLIYLLQKGIPKRKKSRFTQKMKDFILFVNVPLTVFIALIETALIVNSLGA